MPTTIMNDVSEKVDKMDTRALLELFLIIGNELLDRAEGLKEPGPATPQAQRPPASR